jgi:hypothetical protein
VLHGLGVSPKYLSAALDDGSVFKDVKLSHRSGGNLLLPPGCLVACDPFVGFDAQPFSLSVPSGEFLVVLVIAETDSDQRVAFAMIKFSEKAPEPKKASLQGLLGFLRRKN